MREEREERRKERENLLRWVGFALLARERERDKIMREREERGKRKEERGKRRGERREERGERGVSDGDGSWRGRGRQVAYRRTSGEDEGGKESDPFSSGEDEGEGKKGLCFLFIYF